ncbi:MAG TPA: hypothetical protein VEG44_04795 [Candidatus Acidoferrales bacterium]|nr:hypothetical protein [Candidatus Acidoferrales bacterium]
MLISITLIITHHQTITTQRLATAAMVAAVVCDISAKRALSRPALSRPALSRQRRS